MVSATPVTVDWSELTRRSLDELAGASELFRPTSFWGPGLDELLHDLDHQGLARFKAWRTAGFWFYPRYGTGFTNATMDRVVEHVHSFMPAANSHWIRGALSASHEARRDFDAYRLAWDQERWPCDVEGFGESLVGSPFQYYRFTGGPHGWTRPALNYSLCMAALSRHIDGPPRRVLEIGGGFGALGEFLMARDPDVVYVDLDIPPLLTVASWYLRELYGERVSVYDSDVSASGPITPQGSAVLPNYRLPDLDAEFDVFVNSFSFQEMEPDVVESYVDLVVARGIRYAVSLNSRDGKPLRTEENAIGVVDPVTSDRIVEMFARHGFTCVGSYDAPLVSSAGRLVVLEKT